MKERAEDAASANPAESTCYDIAERPKVEFIDNIGENAAAPSARYELDDETNDRCAHFALILRRTEAARLNDASCAKYKVHTDIFAKLLNVERY
jgi:hypothetical protein